MTAATAAWFTIAMAYLATVSLLAFCSRAKIELYSGDIASVGVWVD